MNKNLIIKAIENGEHKDKWDQWLHHKSSEVRGALLDANYKLEQFVNDENEIIRYQLMEKAHHLIPEVVHHNPIDLFMAANIICSEPNVEKEHLKYIRNSSATYDDNYLIRAIDLKIQSMETTPTLIESTMSNSDLFALGNALWAKQYSADQIKTIQSHYREALKIHATNLFFDEFENIYKPTYRPYKMMENFHDLINNIVTL